MSATEPAAPPRVPMNAAHSLPSNFVWALVGNVTYALCQWGVLSAIAKYGTPGMLGQFALALAITTPVILFFNLQLSGAQATDARQEFAFHEYLTLRVVTTAAALLTILAVLLPLRYANATVIVIVAVALAKATDAISDVYAGYLQQQERMRYTGLAQVLNGALTLAGITVVLARGGGIVEAVWASWLASIVALLYYRGHVSGLATSTASSAPRSSTIARLRGLLALSFPLGLTALAVSLYNNAPRYFVEHYAGDAALGYFSAIWCFMTAGTTFMGALGQSATPRLSRYWLTGQRREFRRLLGALVAIAVGLGVGGLAIAAVAGGWTLRVLYRPPYAAHADLLVWVMGIATLAYLSTVLGYAVTATREFRRLTVPFWIVAFVTALACWALVPTFGLVGAVWAAGVTYLAASVACVGVLIQIGAWTPAVTAVAAMALAKRPV